ncbi:hypothetical protein Dimus_033613 [Dionaea muscipula]
MTPTSESAATGHFLRQARTLRLWRIFFAVGRQFDRWGGYSDGNGSRNEELRRSDSQYDDHEGFSDAGVYRYDGGNVEPYGARGTGGSGSSSQVVFDDYGRPIGLPNGKDETLQPLGSNKMVKAIPKSEARGGYEEWSAEVSSQALAGGFWPE